MKSIAVSKTLNSESVRELCAQLSTGIIIRVVTFGALLFALTTHSLYAQVGGDNPTGVSGIFNGNLENTGVDPWTGNAARSITDIAVAGAVGEYPLALVRTANSRAPSTTEVFGWSGGWNHNYNWILEDSPHKNDTNYPARYTVDFPDGRVETFRAVTWDPYYRVRPGPNIPAQSSSAGVRERFQPIHQQNGSLYADIILPDGGMVEFLASLRTDAQGKYYYKYKATAIIDPYGLKTTLTWENYLNNTRKRLIKVQEPAGRYLQFSYTGTNSPRISQVQEFINGVGGRTVQYSYIYCNGCSLGQVFYYGNTQSNTHWTAKYQYTGSNIGGDMPLLLKTCDDPMYAGMKRISYEYKTGSNADQTAAVYGQAWKVRYWNGTLGQENSGPVVSTLTVGEAPNNHVKRKETRGDGAERTFIYNGAGSGYLAWASDFSDRYASQTYDQTTKYIISVMDRRGNTTDYVSDQITGNVTQIKFPSTPNDTQPPQTEQTRSTVDYTYTANYYLHTIRGENGFTTTINRYGDNRIQNILYPDGGGESFTYDGNPFGLVHEHGMITGGTETFSYDARGLRQTYKDSTNTSGNPNARYTYDVYDRVKDVTDVLGGSLGDPAHSSSFTYNDRGQVLVTTLPKDPANNNTRYTISNAYNPDGTLQSTTDQLGHITKYEYDDYRRLKKMTPSVRGFDGDNSEHPSKYYYGANPSDDVNDYKYTDSNATWVVLPSGKTTKVLYDDNRRKQSVTVAFGTVDAATTSYSYDEVGNVTSVTNPLNHNNVTTLYDERNRPSSVSVAGEATTFTYDWYGRKTKIHRPNGQDTTYGDYDQMNRPRQVTATNVGTTKYSYHPGSGLPFTMQDPRLVALGRDPDPWLGYVYTYVYDGMGRKSVVGYPPDSEPRRFEAYTYDASGRLDTYTNRNGKIQTFHYDALNRLSYFTWNDSNPSTPRVDFGYDAASRLTSVNNINATISRGYFNDNLLRNEIETATGGTARTLNYTYDADGNRATLGMPGYSFTYNYTGRSQLLNIKQNGTTLASYVYDLRGNVASRTLNNNTHSDYAPDARDRLTSITHALNGTTRSLNYGYYDDSNNRKWTKRDGGAGDVFGYDLNDQVIAVLLDVDNPNIRPVGDQTIFYDGSGNRTWFSPYDWLEHYTTNDLNQYPERIVTGLEDPRPSPTPRPRPTPIPRPTPPGQQLADYDYTGNMVTGFDGSTYQYDAQNRLTRATNNGTTFEFKYDGLNRQVSRAANGVTTYSVWDGWDLVQEYHKSGNNVIVDASYLYGVAGLVKELGNNRYYYQDGSGSTSHLASSNGTLLEWYWYDLQGLPCILDANNNQRTASAYNVRHFFTGQQWYSELGLYDLRNRFYSPDSGRFLQPDPSGFDGDATNLYRYCGNNPITSSDPMGLEAVHHAGGYYTYVANWRYVAELAALGSYVVLNGSGARLECAGAARYVGGGYVGPVYYNMPKVGNWYQGASISRYTMPGTIVVKNWASDGSYPNMTIAQANERGVPINHTATFGYIDDQGNAHLYAQNPGPMHEEIVPANQVSQWSEVRVAEGNGPYESTPSDRSVAGGNGASSHTGINTRVPSIIGGIFYPYGFGNMSPNMNFAGGRAGTPQGAFTWGQIGDGSTPNFAPPYGGDIAVGEPPECFVAGTLILMADGSEKSIESVAVGEEVLAWNENTKKVFPSKVVAALHHEERLETLFDIELEDGRKFTVNNTHPMYVVEDNDFKFTDDLAGRLAKGESITFQDSKERPVKVASLRMRKEICKMYNLHVEGQGKNGHTYYANGILVHNFGAGLRRK